MAHACLVDRHHERAEGRIATIEETEMTQPFEKLGAFYLGRTYDIDQGNIQDDLLLYDAKDLTTHAVCVGMTGSGKTGLCLSLLEEAAIDQIPAIAIDPKGDLGNLLLTFPDLRPADFRPWIEEGDAARKGLSPDDYAKNVAATWKKGLAGWGQDGARIAALRDAAEINIYTPGSHSGLPLSVLRSFRAPGPKLREEPDALRERVLATVSGLLALLGIEADPIRSREHILLSNILDTRWRGGKSLDVAALIREIQEPPLTTVGVLDLESFYPGKDRFDLAMTLNNLLASPGFAAWMEGDPLDVQRLLYTPEGRPRISILSIAHLSDTERMFFVTLLLNEIVAWMRTQPGSTSLRALLYMDEVFGFFPPTANPPSKTPMLTLLKQARAFGLGVVLATQNPVDLDYKGLSNAGTWFLGRLQTERDKARVLDGLEGASTTSGSSFDRKRTEVVLSGLKSRVFLMNNVHEDRPAIFHTRWAMSYLRGPLTRTQIKTLMEPRKRETPVPPGAARTTPTQAVEPKVPAAEPTPVPAQSQARPVVPPGIRERFLAFEQTGAETQGLHYRPSLLGPARLHFVRARQKIDEWREVRLLASLPEEVVKDPWPEATDLSGVDVDLQEDPEESAAFAVLPPQAAQAKSYRTWSTSLKNHLYRERSQTVWICKALKATSGLGESEGDFRARLVQTAREQRDLAVEKLRKKYAPKLARMEERIRKVNERVEREKAQYKQQKLQTAISMGATVLGALFGRKLASAGTVGRATTAVRGVGRAAREKGQIAAATESLEALQQQLAALEAEFEEETAELQETYAPDALELEAVQIRPRKSDIAIGDLTLAWVPWRKRADGFPEPAYQRADVD
jgi:hypothetical protein